MTRRHPIIDPAGHVERPARIVTAIACERCQAIRLRGMKREKPCAADETPSMGTVVPATRGFYHGRNKEET